MTTALGSLELVLSVSPLSFMLINHSLIQSITMFRSARFCQYPFQDVILRPSLKKRCGRPQDEHHGNGKCAQNPPTTRPGRRCSAAGTRPINTGFIHQNSMNRFCPFISHARTAPGLSYVVYDVQLYIIYRMNVSARIN